LLVEGSVFILKSIDKKTRDNDMSQAQFYQWWGELWQQFPGLSKPLLTGLTLLVSGIIQARASHLTKLAEALVEAGKPDTVERRLQRWLANGRVEVEACQQCWMRWLLSAYVSQRLVLLVDETKLSDHLSVMMVGLPCYGRCLPLVWRCYRPGSSGGQVAVILGLLGQVRAVLPATTCPLVQADRGIGTAPDLLRGIAGLGWHYLMRVQGGSKVRTGMTRRGKRRYACWRRVDSLVQPGQSWQRRTTLFKKRGQLTAWVLVLWQVGEKEAWCLVTNDRMLRAEAYALRAWQEQGFRDLKRGGWHWNHSRVWQPAHADRLVLALAIAYAWVMTQGTALLEADPATLRQVTRGKRQRFSWFRLGWRWLNLVWARGESVAPGLRFCPEPLLC
jgi:hypothetical protein